MTEPRMPDLRTLDDAGIEVALRALAPEIAWPAAASAGAPDPATRVRVRLQDRSVAPARPRWAWRSPAGSTPGRLPRAAVLALLALLALAAVAGAVGLGLPGIRLILGQPPASAIPSPSSAPTRPSVSPGLPGSGMGLGRAVTLEEARALTGRPLPLPADPGLGPPDAVYVDGTRADQVALVWATRPGLPASLEPGVGLILMSFDGRLSPSFATKIIGLGTSIEPLEVDGDPGFWISGAPHFFFYESSGDVVVEDSRRWVGDALIWADGTTTYRLESALGREASITLAITIP